jgi:hypothetical protein
VKEAEAEAEAISTERQRGRGKAKRSKNPCVVCLFCVFFFFGGKLSFIFLWLPNICLCMIIF